MQLLPVRDDKTFVDHVYYIVLAWIVVTLLVGTGAAVIAL
jgi:hypothetical protein